MSAWSEVWRWGGENTATKLKTNVCCSERDDLKQHIWESFEGPKAVFYFILVIKKNIYICICQMFGILYLNNLLSAFTLWVMCFESEAENFVFFEHSFIIFSFFLLQSFNFDCYFYLFKCDVLLLCIYCTYVFLCLCVCFSWTAFSIWALTYYYYYYFLWMLYPVIKKVNRSHVCLVLWEQFTFKKQ